MFLCSFIQVFFIDTFFFLLCHIWVYSVCIYCNQQHSGNRLNVWNCQQILNCSRFDIWTGLKALNFPKRWLCPTDRCVYNAIWATQQVSRTKPVQYVSVVLYDCTVRIITSQAAHFPWLNIEYQAALFHSHQMAHLLAATLERNIAFFPKATRPENESGAREVWRIEYLWRQEMSGCHLPLGPT